MNKDNYTLELLDERELQIKREMKTLNEELKEIEKMRTTIELASLKQKTTADKQAIGKTYGAAKMYLTHH